MSVTQHKASHNERQQTRQEAAVAIMVSQKTRRLAFQFRVQPLARLVGASQYDSTPNDIITPPAALSNSSTFPPRSDVSRPIAPCQTLQNAYLYSTNAPPGTSNQAPQPRTTPLRVPSTQPQPLPPPFQSPSNNPQHGISHPWPPPRPHALHASDPQHTPPRLPVQTHAAHSVRLVFCPWKSR